MLDIILYVLAVTVAAPSGASEALSGAPGAVAMAPDTVLVAEPQDPDGRFTTAFEVRPILDMTRANWVAVRDYDGQDLVYVTHLWSFRCGLLQIRVAITDAAAEVWPMPPCYSDTAQRNAITGEDGLPYRAFPAATVKRLGVEVTYDDLTTARIDVDRSAVLIP